MHETPSRVLRLRPSRLLIKLSSLGLCVAACASGCATELNTVEPQESGTAGRSEMSAGSSGDSTSGGAPSRGTAGMPGSAGTPITNAFGGTASGGSSGAGGHAGAATSGTGGQLGAGGKAQGGAGGTAAGSGSGGNKNGGAAGQAGSGGKGNGGAGSGGAGNGGAGSGGSAAGGSAGSAGGGNLACLAGWRNDACDTCSKQTQSDKQACALILDCYAANSCGPATCGGNTDKCGANNIGKGSAGYPIAQEVYTCLCP